MLTYLFSGEKHIDQIPKSKAALYLEFLNQLYSREEELRFIETPQTIREEFLGYLATKLGNRATVFKRGEGESWIKELYEQEYQNSGINLEVLFHEVLDLPPMKALSIGKNTDISISFMHQSFQEYYAAYNLNKQRQKNTIDLNYIVKLGDPINEHWWETLTLFVGLQENATPVIHALKSFAVEIAKERGDQRILTLLRAVDKEVEDAVHRYPRLRLMYLRDAAIVKLILYAGLRVGEIIQLRMSDLFLDERKGSVVVREGKGTKRREIPLSARARKAILDYLRVKPEVESEYLFLGQRNEAIQSKTVQRAVGRFTDTTDLKDASPHTLRHTFAKSLIDSGVSLDKVATLLGHSNLNTTRIYTTPGVQDLEDAISELDNF